MARIRVRTEVDRGDTLEGVEKILADPARLLTHIGLIGTAYAQQAFEEQRLGDIPWAPRAVPNVAGIVRDVNSGKNPGPNRFEDRPALVDTGVLQSSIAHEVLDDDTVEVGTTVPYADVHQRGGTVDRPLLTPVGRRQLWEWMKRQGMGRQAVINRRFAEARKRAQASYLKRTKQNRADARAEAPKKDPQQVAWAKKIIRRTRGVSVGAGARDERRRAYEILREHKIKTGTRRSDYEVSFREVTKKKATLWDRASREIMRDALANDWKVQKALGIIENAPEDWDSSDMQRDELKHARKVVREARAKVKERLQGGVMNAELRAKVVEIRGRARNMRDAQVSRARERRDTQLEKLRERQQGNHLFPFAQQLGWLFNAKPGRMKIEPRPFLGIPPDMAREVEDYFGVRIGLAG